VQPILVIPGGLVLVVMVAVGGVPMPVVLVVNMAAVADCLVPATGAVRVGVARMGQMRKRMLVVVVIVRCVGMTFMDVVDMSLALDACVSAVRSVLVLMGRVG
jgi:hypothetical protein